MTQRSKKVPENELPKTQEKQYQNDIKHVVLATVYFPNDELKVFQSQETQDMFREAVENSLKGLEIEVRMNYLTSLLHDKVEIQYDHFKL